MNGRSVNCNVMELRKHLGLKLSGDWILLGLGLVRSKGAKRPVTEEHGREGERAEYVHGREHVQADL
jgi:hypothetical protein